MTAGERTTGGSRFEVVVLGGSAGALDPMKMVLSGLESTFPAAIAVVLHRVPDMRSMLSGILTRVTPLEVVDAEEGSTLAPGRVVVAPAGRHLVLEPGNTLSFREGRIHYVSSAIDPVMESAAAAYGEGVIAVVLSGGGEDGTPGARAVREAGGVVIVQTPDTAGTARMPQSVIDAGAADLVLPAEEIAAALNRLVIVGREEPGSAN